LGAGEAPIELARRLAPVLKALSDEKRLAILLAIAGRDLSVTELTVTTGLPRLWSAIT
jgi:DNA-binding transcriptional ArsR family regulator